MIRTLNLPTVSPRSFRVWQRNRDVYLRLWKSELMWPLVEPIITLLALGLGLGTFVDLGTGERYIEFIVPGLFAVFPMWAAAGETAWGSYMRMETQGTYQAIIATPLTIEDVVAGEIFWGATRAAMSTTYIMAVAAVFGLLDSLLVILVLPFAFVQGVMFSAIGLAYTSIARSISSLNYFFALYITPQFWLSGAFFPLDSLPDWVGIASWFVPVTHVVNIYRGLTEGAPQWSHLGDLAWILVVGTVFFYISMISMRRRIIH